MQIKWQTSPLILRTRSKCKSLSLMKLIRLTSKNYKKTPSISQLFQNLRFKCRTILLNLPNHLKMSHMTNYQSMISTTSKLNQKEIRIRSHNRLIVKYKKIILFVNHMARWKQWQWTDQISSMLILTTRDRRSNQ